MSQPEIDLSPAALDDDFFDEETSNKQSNDIAAKDGSIMDIEAPSLDADNKEIETVSIRDDAINVKGVDELSTQDVLKIMESIIPNEPFRIEWIDDHSLNLQFPEDTSMIEAMRKLTGDTTFEPVSRVDMLSVRDMVQTEQMKESFPNVELFIRFATIKDVKERGARNRSRYYLFYGEPNSNKEEQARLSTAYQKYLERISKNPATQKKLSKPWHEKKNIDTDYHQRGDLLPDFDPNNPKPRASQSDNDDLFPEVAAERSKRRRQRSRSPQRGLAKSFSERVDRRSRSKSPPPTRSFADIINKRSRRKAADLF